MQDLDAIQEDHYAPETGVDDPIEDEDDEPIIETDTSTKDWSLFEPQD
jgi:hypothetical protein